MVASPLTGLTPMLASKPVGVRLETLVGTHVFDEKLDGLRAMVAFDGERVWLRGRNGKDLLPHFPEIEDAALVLLPPGVVLDGEITTTTFEDVNHRAMMTPQRIRLARATLPLATFNAFDVVGHPLNPIAEASWETRRALLEALNLSGRFRATTASDNPAFFDIIRAEGGEGVIAKRVASRYRAGRSPDWLKFKATHRVTCIAYGYDPGTGSRKDFGAVLLALITDEQTTVKIGRAGSGFTESTIATVKASLDTGTPVVVEIECLGLTSGGQLRQPVFKGVRTDLSILDASTTQLRTIPKG
jgi:bifunctional non-homologous end joining protein LigD